MGDTLHTGLTGPAGRLSLPGYQDPVDEDGRFVGAPPKPRPKTPTLDEGTVLTNGGRLDELDMFEPDLEPQNGAPSLDSYVSGPASAAAPAGPVGFAIPMLEVGPAHRAPLTRPHPSTYLRAQLRVPRPTRRRRLRARPSRRA